MVEKPARDARRAAGNREQPARLFQRRKHLRQERIKGVRAHQRAQVQQVALVAQGDERFVWQREGVNIQRVAALHVLVVFRRGRCIVRRINNGNVRVRTEVLRHQRPIHIGQAGIHAQGAARRGMELRCEEPQFGIAHAVAIIDHQRGQTGARVQRRQIADGFHSIIGRRGAVNRLTVGEIEGIAIQREARVCLVGGQGAKAAGFAGIRIQQGEAAFVDAAYGRIDTRQQLPVRQGHQEANGRIRKRKG